MSRKQLLKKYEDNISSNTSSSPSSTSSTPPPTPAQESPERIFLTPPPQRSPNHPEDAQQQVSRDFTFNHHPQGAFSAPKIYHSPATFLPRPIPPPPFLIAAIHAPAYFHYLYPHPHHPAIPHLPILAPPHLKQEPDHSLLRHALPELIIEPVKEEPGSPRPSSSFTSSFTASSPRSVGMSPTGSHPGEGPTPPPSGSGSRKRRRQDTLIPEGCPLTKKEIVELPIDEFNELLEKGGFTEEQKAKFRYEIKLFAWQGIFDQV